MSDRTILTNSVCIFDDDIEVPEKRAEMDALLRSQTCHNRPCFCQIKVPGKYRNGHE